MNKKVQIETSLKKAYFNARKAWLDYLRGLVAEYGTLELKDENNSMGVPFIHAQDSNHYYVYDMSFDKIAVGLSDFGMYFTFHVVDDGGWGADEWVSENDFTDDSWEELLDWIVWPED